MQNISFKKILCPTDFSDFSYHAINYGIAMAKQNKNSELYIVHVIPFGSMVSPLVSLPYIENSDVNLEEIAVKAAKERLETFVNKKIPTNLNTKIEILRGIRAHDSINEYAEEYDIDVIVIATHGYSGVKHAIFGSTTERLIRNASCPVLSINPIRKDGKT